MQCKRWTSTKASMDPIKATIMAVLISIMTLKYQIHHKTTTKWLLGMILIFEFFPEKTKQKRHQQFSISYYLNFFVTKKIIIPYHIHSVLESTLHFPFWQLLCKKMKMYTQNKNLWPDLLLFFSCFLQSKSHLFAVTFVIVSRELFRAARQSISNHAKTTNFTAHTQILDFFTFW